MRLLHAPELYLSLSTASSEQMYDCNLQQNWGQH